jgi:hypothetical protein
VLIHDFVQLPRAFDEVCALLLADPSGFFSRPASEAYEQGEQLSASLAPSVRHPRLGNRVFLDVGRPYRREDRLMLPIQWWVPGASALFPRLEGDLELAPLGSETTQITLMGRYDPPLASLGEAMDRLLLHRVAEKSVRRFLKDVAADLMDAPTAATA